MSDNNVNNVNNTPETQPGYENFNQYSQGAPAQPIYVAANGVIADNSENEKKAKTLGIWGIVLAVTACCCGITAFIGLGLSISGLKKSKGNTLCIVALILNILAIVANIGSNIYVQSNPEFMNQYSELLQQMQQVQQTVPAGSILSGIFH